MTERRFGHANNPGFTAADGLIMLPFGRCSFLPEIVSALGGVEVELDETTDRIVYTLEAAPRPLTLMYSGMGSPAMANALEMAANNGARRVVLFGACGGVAERVAVGHLIVATGAVRGEGTSAYYAPPEFPALFDTGLVCTLWQRAAAQRVTAHRGVVYTTDAGYRQGPEIYEACAGLVLAVESECAAAAVVGARLGLEVAALLFCTDNVNRPQSEEQSYRGLRNRSVRAGFEAGLRIVAEVLAGT